MAPQEWIFSDEISSLDRPTDGGHCSQYKRASNSNLENSLGIPGPDLAIVGCYGAEIGSVASVLADGVSFVSDRAWF